MPVDPTRSKSAQERQKFDGGGPVNDPPKKEYAPFNVLPFREDETGIHFDKDAGLLGPITRGAKIARQAAPTWMGGEGRYDPNNPEDFKATQDLAGLAFGSGTAFNKAPKGAIGSFAGPRAEGVNLDTYREAQKAFREANFMDPQTERSMAARYGWSPYGRDPKTGDLRLFTEGSDAPAKFDLTGGTQKFIEREREDLSRKFDQDFSDLDISPKTKKAMIDERLAKDILNKGVSGPLKEFYSNPYVFSAYPHFENMQLNVVPKNKVSRSGNAQAAYKFRRDNAIDPYINLAKSVAKNPQEAKLAVAHELQHGGQHFEDTLGPITNFEDHPDYPNIPNPAYQLYQEALVSDPTMQKLKVITTSPDFVRAKQVWNDQFRKRQSEILRTVDGVVDIEANKSALIDKLHHEISAAFPAFAEAFSLTKELEAKGIPSAAPNKYIGKDEAYILSQDEAQARNTEYRHDWDDLKRQMNYPKDTMPLDSNSTGRLGFIPFNRLHNFADGGTVERPTKMNKKVKHALDVALSETHPKRFHHTLARTGYADGGLPDMSVSPPDLANEVPYTHEKALASQFDVAKSAPYKPKSITLGITKIAPPKKVGLRAPRSDIGKMRLRKNISVKPKKFKLASRGHPEIDDALRLASRTMSDMDKHIGDEGVHGASMQQGSTSTIVKEKVPGKKSEIVYEHHAKTPTETETFASGGGAWTRAEGKDPEGGLNEKGRASLRAQGHDIKPPAPHPKTDKDAARRKSFCARMGASQGPLKDDKGKPTRKALSLRAWNCRADGGRLMHQDIIDALNLAQRRRHFAAGGFGSPNAMTVGPSPEESKSHSIRQYLDYLYQNELGRAADEGGRDYWLQQLNNGMHMDQVQQMFDQSQEGQTFNQRPQQPPPFSNDPRNPHLPGIPKQKPNPPFPVDENPRYGWEPWLGGGGNNPFPPGTTPDVMNPRNDPYAGGGMPEIGPRILPGQGQGPGPNPNPYGGLGNGTKAGGQGIGGQGPTPQLTPLEQINNLYQSQLGRQADEGGRNYWLQQLQGGMSPDQIRQTFANTQEGQDYQKRLTFTEDMGAGVGYPSGGNGTKAGGGGGMPYPGGLGGQGQSPNPNPYGGLGNGTKAGGGGGMPYPGGVGGQAPGFDPNPYDGLGNGTKAGGGGGYTGIY